MNLQLVRIEQDGSAKTFVYEDLDNPDRPLIYVTHAQICEAIKSFSEKIDKVTASIRAMDFTQTIEYLRTFQSRLPHSDKKGTS